MAHQDVLDRLENLYRKLDEEGWHVKANTVSLAADEIKKLRSALHVAKDFLHSFIIDGDPIVLATPSDGNEFASNWDAANEAIKAALAAA